MIKLAYQIDEMELSNGIKTLIIGFPIGYESLSDLFSSDISVHSAKWFWMQLIGLSPVLRILNNLEVMLAG
ncbi:hypothetical protein YSY22_13050 [Brevibacillus formosus]